jgi:hypothetical protein
MTPWLAALCLLIAAGSLSEYSWQKVRPCIPEIGRKELEPTLGQGVLLGILGGLRTVVADLTWIRSYVLWERKDRPGCEALMRTACVLDPHSRYFWENTGYAIGYDLAHWEVRRRGGYAKVTKEIQDRLYRAYARRGLAVIDEGLAYAKNKVSLLLCAAQLSELKLGDRKMASQYYRQAAEIPRSPWYAARFHARIEWEIGSKTAAYAWYRQYWLSRMKDVDDGFPDDLMELREMENQLKLPLLARIPRQTWEK